MRRGELETEEEDEISRTRQTQRGAVGKGCFLATRMQCVVGAKRRQNDAKRRQVETDGRVEMRMRSMRVSIAARG